RPLSCFIIFSSSAFFSGGIFSISFFILALPSGESSSFIVSSRSFCCSVGLILLIFSIWAFICACWSELRPLVASLKISSSANANGKEIQRTKNKIAVFITFPLEKIYPLKRYVHFLQVLSVQKLLRSQDLSTRVLQQISQHLSSLLFPRPQHKVQNSQESHKF